MMALSSISSDPSNAAADGYGVSYITQKLLRKLSGQEDLSAVTHLRIVLKERRIPFIENLEVLTSLVSLNLSHNAISHLNGLNALVCMEELIVKDNKLTKIDGIWRHSARLKLLDLSNNLIERIPATMKKMSSLNVLKLSNNRLTILRDAVSPIKQLENLTILALDGNPMALAAPHYRPWMIFSLRTLESLDGTSVTEDERSIAVTRFSREHIDILEGELAKACEKLKVISKERDAVLAEKQECLEREMSTLSDNKRLLAEMEILKIDIAAKDQLLQSKTFELNRASSKHYRLEQELAFFKIDLAVSNVKAPEVEQLDSEESDTPQESAYFGKGVPLLVRSTSSNAQPMSWKLLKEQLPNAMDLALAERECALNEIRHLDDRITAYQNDPVLNDARVSVEALQIEADKWSDSIQQAEHALEQHRAHLASIRARKQSESDVLEAKNEESELELCLHRLQCEYSATTEQLNHLQSYQKDHTLLSSSLEDNLSEYIRRRNVVTGIVATCDEEIRHMEMLLAGDICEGKDSVNYSDELTRNMAIEIDLLRTELRSARNTSTTLNSPSDEVKYLRLACEQDSNVRKNAELEVIRLTSMNCELEELVATTEAELNRLRDLERSACSEANYLRTQLNGFMSGVSSCNAAWHSQTASHSKVDHTVLGPSLSRNDLIDISLTKSTADGADVIQDNISAQPVLSLNDPHLLVQQEELLKEHQYLSNECESLRIHHAALSSDVMELELQQRNALKRLRSTENAWQHVYERFEHATAACLQLHEDGYDMTAQHLETLRECETLEGRRGKLDHECRQLLASKTALNSSSAELNEEHNRDHLSNVAELKCVVLENEIHASTESLTTVRTQPCAAETKLSLIDAQLTESRCEVTRLRNKVQLCREEVLNSFQIREPHSVPITGLNMSDITSLLGRRDVLSAEVDRLTELVQRIAVDYDKGTQRNKKHNAALVAEIDLNEKLKASLEDEINNAKALLEKTLATSKITEEQVITTDNILRSLRINVQHEQQTLADLQDAYRTASSYLLLDGRSQSDLSDNAELRKKVHDLKLTLQSTELEAEDSLRQLALQLRLEHRRVKEVSERAEMAQNDAADKELIITSLSERALAAEAVSAAKTLTLASLSQMRIADTDALAKADEASSLVEKRFTDAIALSSQLQTNIADRDDALVAVSNENDIISLRIAELETICRKQELLLSEKASTVAAASQTAPCSYEFALENLQAENKRILELWELAKTSLAKAIAERDDVLERIRQNHYFSEHRIVELEGEVVRSTTFAAALKTESDMRAGELREAMKLLEESRTTSMECSKTHSLEIISLTEKYENLLSLARQELQESKNEILVSSRNSEINLDEQKSTLFKTRSELKDCYQRLAESSAELSCSREAHDIVCAEVEQHREHVVHMERMLQKNEEQMDLLYEENKNERDKASLLSKEFELELVRRDDLQRMLDTREKNAEENIRTMKTSVSELESAYSSAVARGDELEARCLKLEDAMLAAENSYSVNESTLKAECDASKASFSALEKTVAEMNRRADDADKALLDGRNHEKIVSNELLETQSLLKHTERRLIATTVALEASQRLHDKLELTMKRERSRVQYELEGDMLRKMPSPDYIHDPDDSSLFEQRRHVADSELAENMMNLRHIFAVREERIIARFRGQADNTKLAINEVQRHNQLLQQQLATAVALLGVRGHDCSGNNEYQRVYTSFYELQQLNMSVRLQMQELTHMREHNFNIEDIHLLLDERTAEVHFLVTKLQQQRRFDGSISAAL